MRFSELSLSSLLHDHCSDALNSKVTLLRGSKHNEPFFVGSIRQDRLPRNSTELQVRVFDLYMESKGYPFRKSNALSVTFDSVQASLYGELYKIYPYNGATYLWSTTVRDFLFISMVLITRLREYNTYEELIDKDDSYLKSLITIISFEEDFGLSQTKNINDLSNAKGEILILGTQYVAVKDS